jgi:TusE/DsrC/DsvC family sulfur relay protein
MPSFRYDGGSVEVNAEGFVLDGSQWTPQLAEALARDSQIWPLTERHWKVLTFCREDAAQQGQSPGLRRIAKHSGIDMKELYRLFPKGPGKLAARLAGLPKPQSCV